MEIIACEKAGCTLTSKAMIIILPERSFTKSNGNREVILRYLFIKIYAIPHAPTAQQKTLSKIQGDQQIQFD